jgi:hypothetical protein
VGDVVYGARAVADPERLVGLRAKTAPDATVIAGRQPDAVGILDPHPRIGRPAEHDACELLSLAAVAAISRTTTT